MRDKSLGNISSKRRGNVDIDRRSKWLGYTFLKKMNGFISLYAVFIFKIIRWPKPIKYLIPWTIDFTNILI